MADAPARRAERTQEAVQRFTFEQYEPTVESFDCYLERFENELAIIAISFVEVNQMMVEMILVPHSRFFP